MYEPSKNTVYIAIAFTSIAALVGAYSYWDDVSYALCDVVKPEANNGEVRLIDDEGKSYTLINHGDGKVFHHVLLDGPPKQHWIYGKHGFQNSEVSHKMTPNPEREEKRPKTVIGKDQENIAQRLKFGVQDKL